ncbi:MULTISPECIES: DsbA family protein [unclassified Sphingomonas]|uniref:DsbA family protein n=1 Tax=unclassified Sphingomonas TaxID=196159 RepID=UPI001F57C905|nr:MULTISPECIES: DsbA family protein [unclassified Sphingomonas]
MKSWPLLTAALLGAIGGSLALLAYDRTDQRARTERIVHDYVLANPQIIPEAMEKLRANDAGQVIAANRAQIVTPVGDAWIGNPKGDVTLVEYYDYNCGYCRASLPMIQQLVARDPKLKVVFRDLPVLSEQSGTAAQLSVAAALAGKFKPFHDTLYAAGPITPASLAAASRAAGFDPQALATAGSTPAVTQAIRTNLALARQLGMAGTPAWVVGDQVLAGALPIETVEAAIAAARGTR